MQHLTAKELAEHNIETIPKSHYSKRYKTFSPYIDDIIKYTSFLDTSASFSERLYCMLNGLTDKPKCKCCGINPTAYKNSEIGYLETCSRKCSGLMASKNNGRVKAKEQIIKDVESKLFAAYNSSSVYSHEEVLEIVTRWKNDICKHGISYHNKQIRDEMCPVVTYTNFLPIDASLKTRMYCIENKISRLPKCKNCGKEISKIFNDGGNIRFRDYCSTKCSTTHVETQSKSKETCLERYGVVNPSKSQDIKQKKIETCKTNYGVDYPSQSGNIINKMINTSLCKDESQLTSYERGLIKYKETCLERYGVDNPHKTERVKLKTLQTMMNKYGVANPMHLDNSKQKYKETCLERYGVVNPSKSQDIKQKKIETCKTNYGVDYGIQSEEIFNKTMKSLYKSKPYEFKSGRVDRVQGYEPIALDILVQYFDEDDIMTSFDFGIWYFNENRNKRSKYYPDIYIKSKNLIIEVKSEYTYKINLEINKSKEQATKEMGYDFMFMIFDVNGNIINESFDEPILIYA